MLPTEHQRDNRLNVTFHHVADDAKAATVLTANRLLLVAKAATAQSKITGMMAGRGARAAPGWGPGSWHPQRDHDNIGDDEDDVGRMQARGTPVNSVGPGLSPFI
jgi:hypothetical protein